MSTDGSERKSVGVSEVGGELQGLPPFNRLPLPVLEVVARKVEVRYVRRGSPILRAGDLAAHVSWIRSGSVECRGVEGALEERLEEGECFGHGSVLSGGPSPSSITAHEDTLLHQLSAQDFRDVVGVHPSFARYFRNAPWERLRVARESLSPKARAGTSLLAIEARELVTRLPVVSEVGLSIREAALRMTRERVSCLPVLRDGELVGIMTDRDLRTRVLAGGSDPEGPVETIMTPEPVALRAGSTGFEALLTMVRLGVHHLPVVDEGRLIGVITATDLIRREHGNPVYVVADVRRAATAEAVVKAAQGRERVFIDLVEAGMPPDKVSDVLTGLVDALTVRLIELAADELGPSPAEWSWLAFGSQARGESGLHSDQDHGILVRAGEPGGLDDEVDRWFASMAEAVSAGLRSAGYPSCPGRVMATESRWRKSLSGWEATFRDWVLRPVPDALLHAGVFFDFREPGWAGESGSATRLRREILQATKGNDIFVAHLATATLGRSPPLGVFRRLVLERDGKGSEVLDLKHRGVTPIVDLVRVQALEVGVDAVGTRGRIDAVREAGTLSPGGAADLREAFDFVSLVRFRHQARQLARGVQPDSLVPPGELSPLERRHLRDVFRVVRDHRELFERRLQTGFLG